MHHPRALVAELDLLHGQALEPEEQRRVAPCRVIPNRLNLRTLNQARDLTFVTMNCLDNSHDHRGHGPYRVTTQGPRARSSSKSRFTPFLAFGPALRKVIYTTNSIESLNARFRAATRRRGQFPDQDAALKVLYLTVLERQKNRPNPTGRINGWKAILNTLSMTYGDRLGLK